MNPLVVAPTAPERWGWVSDALIDNVELWVVLNKGPSCCHHSWVAQWTERTLAWWSRVIVDVGVSVGLSTFLWMSLSVRICRCACAQCWAV